MTTNPPETGRRLHALDNLRALMMWLGIVLHVAAIYMAGVPVLPWRDEQRTRVADFLMAFIHSFRMPVFFILAGFFVALLLQSRGPAGMARHRARRLGLPFAVFWLPVFVASATLSLVFLHQMARGRWGFDPTLLPGDVPQGPSTLHMWFLWMLLWLSLGTAAAARWLPARLFAGPAKVLQTLGAAWWGPLVLVLPLVAAGWDYPRGLLRPGGAFVPPWTEWLHNGLFYVFGVALFHQQWQLFDLYRRRWGAYALAGLVPFLVSGALFEHGGAAGWIAFSYNLASWLWSFALIGLALKVLDGRHAALAYLADSSYWVYLVHLPLTMLFGLLLYAAPLPALAKMPLNIAATTLVCLASYHLFVRFTWVSVLLNGKRHARTPATGVLSHVGP
jgi:surface polysaccharide O-acyltransferase-like enzyme